MGIDRINIYQKLKLTKIIFMNDLLDAFKLVTFPIHKEGYKFIIIFALVTIILTMLSNTLGLIGLVITLWCVFFFRDPERIIPLEEKI